MAGTPLYKAADLLINTPVERSFTYKVPEGMELSPGMRVKVNFAGRVTAGYVISLHNNIPSGFELKDIIEEMDYSCKGYSQIDREKNHKNGCKDCSKPETRKESKDGDQKCAQ